MSEHVDVGDGNKGKWREKVWTSAYLWGWARVLGLFQWRRAKGRFSDSMKRQSRTLSRPWLRPASSRLRLWRWANNAKKKPEKKKKFLPKFSAGTSSSSGSVCSRGRWRKWRNSRRWCFNCKCVFFELSEKLWGVHGEGEREGRVTQTSWAKVWLHRALFTSPTATPGLLTSLPQVLPLILRALHGPHTSFIKWVFHRNPTDPQSH